MVLYCNGVLILVTDIIHRNFGSFDVIFVILAGWSPVVNRVDWTGFLADLFLLTGLYLFWHAGFTSQYPPGKPS